MVEENENVNGDNNPGNGYQLRTSVADRIRRRSSGNGSGSNNGSGNDDSGISGNIPGSNIGELTTTNVSSGLRIEGTSVSLSDVVNRSDDTSGATGSERDSDSNNDRRTTDRKTRTVPPRISIEELDTPSLLRVSEIIPDEDFNGLVIKGDARRKPGRPAGSTTKKKTSAGNNDDLVLPLKILCGFVFSIPVYFGYGHHWGLSEEENNELSTNVGNVLAAFPSKTAIDFLKSMDKYMPLLILGMSLYTMISIRWEKTRLGILASKRQVTNAARTSTLHAVKTEAVATQMVTPQEPDKSEPQLVGEFSDFVDKRLKL